MRGDTLSTPPTPFFLLYLVSVVPGVSVVVALHVASPLSCVLWLHVLQDEAALVVVVDAVEACAALKAGAVQGCDIVSLLVPLKVADLEERKKSLAKCKR